MRDLRRCNRIGISPLTLALPLVTLVMSGVQISVQAQAALDRGVAASRAWGSLGWEERTDRAAATPQRFPQLDSRKRGK
jgi:hypothetical protein